MIRKLVGNFFCRLGVWIHPAKDHYTHMQEGLESINYACIECGATITMIWEPKYVRPDVQCECGGVAVATNIQED